MRAEDVVLVLLAAGQSSRFGKDDKMEQDLCGLPLGLHVVRALDGLRFRERIAIVHDCRIDFGSHGYRVLPNEQAMRGMSTSVRLGARAAGDLHAGAMLIVLADMPCVTADHVRRLLEAADAPDAVVASGEGAGIKPPALFGSRRFDALLRLTGDAGARELIKAGTQILTTPEELVDIDTPADLAALRARMEAEAAAIRAGAHRSD